MTGPTTSKEEETKTKVRAKAGSQESIASATRSVIKTLTAGSTFCRVAISRRPILIYFSFWGANKVASILTRKRTNICQVI